tara:strand:+ start:14357 stop:15208 length:852 start_codon:yes stop_codon:yes gene_type:complete
MKAELNVQETTPLSQEDVSKLSSENIDENGKILGKFNSQEELIKSYKELEKLNTEKNQKPLTQETEETESTIDQDGSWDQFYNEDGSVDYLKTKEAYGEKLGELFEENGVDPFKISKHFHENNGTITEEMYDELLGTGLTKAVIDSYLQGRANEQGYTQQVDPYNDIVAIAGGEKEYREMLEYVGTLPSDQIDAFNNIVDAETPNVPQIAVTVQNMYNQYKQAMGIEPKLMSGKSPTARTTNTFRSNAEVVAAMRDPRYKKDIAYQHEVQRKLAESDVFGISE